MKDLFRETTFGTAVRLLSGGKYLAHDEILYPEAIQGYHAGKSAISSTSGINMGIADAEKGTDVQLVEWVIDDPHNPRNWSTPKKLFVTFQVCLLTTSVYIGEYRNALEMPHWLGFVKRQNSKT